MEQYIENYNKPNEKWHITMWVDLPNYSPRGILNFRIKSIVNNLEETISDPNFPNSTYIFRLDNSFINKRVFFHFSFSTKDILTVQSFQFGLCDEGVRWVHVDGLAEVKNESYEFLISRKIQEEIGDKLKLLKEKESSENIDSVESVDFETKDTKPKFGSQSIKKKKK